MLPPLYNCKIGAQFLNLRLSREVRRASLRGRRRRPGNRQGPGQEPRPAQGGRRGAAVARGAAQRWRRSVATTTSRPERMPTQRGGAPPTAEGRASCGPAGGGERHDRGGGAQSRGRRVGPQGRATGPLRIALRANTRHRCEAPRRRTALGGVTGQGRGSDGIAARSILFCARGDTFAGRPSPSGGT